MKRSINDRDVIYTFSLNKHTFDLIWHNIFAKNKTPYAFWERDRLWDLMTCEHQEDVDWDKVIEVLEGVEEYTESSICRDGKLRGLTIDQALKKLQEIINA